MHYHVLRLPEGSQKLRFLRESGKSSLTTRPPFSLPPHSPVYQCKSGEECKGGRCVPIEECKGAVCGSFKRCFGTSCSCYTSPNKQGFCGQDISCKGAKKCNKDTDCRGGTRCALSTCCGFNTCLPNCRKEQGFRFLGLPDAPAPSQGASSSSNQGGSAGGDDD